KLIQDALGRALPNQGRILDALSPLLRMDAKGLPPQLREAVAQQRERIPQPQALTTAAGLKQALRLSGAFTEHKLLASAPAPARPSAPEPGSSPTAPTGASGLLANLLGSNSSPDLKIALVKVFAALAQAQTQAPTQTQTQTAAT